ncbi:MAG: hypothetical protein ACE5GI_08760 [Candidatus Aminicenantales bacterium]
MRADKFGIVALIIGIIILFGMLHYFFMEPAGGWGWDGLWAAIIIAVKGGLLLLGLCLIIIGILLLVL